MGTALFESSGTFKPGDYGLSPGDLIHVIAVGGGGGGAVSSDYAGSAGKASSFGRYLTATGGDGGSNSQTPSTNAKQAHGSCCMYGNSLYLPNGSGFTSVYFSCGGWGADGYIPGKLMGCNASTDSLQILFTKSSTYYSSAFGTNNLFYTAYAGRSVPIVANRYDSTSWYNGIVAEYSPQVGLRAGNAGIAYTYGYTFAGVGGIGYGAGGGSNPYNYSNDGFGGNAGEIAQRDLVISAADLSGIAVTVGKGGSGANSSDSSNLYKRGGGGNRGCVHIFW